jgi:hypothetical protein
MTGRDGDVYGGFEQGPIRPPSEARSLLVRVTRNCPWNRCAFCPVYKGARFSLRPVEHVKRDIDDIHKHVQALQRISDEDGHVQRAALVRLAESVAPEELQVLDVAWRWFASGMESVFLQDANSLVIKPPDLIDILQHLKKRFPWVQRVTSYARSHTLARIKDEDLALMREAGLSRIHTGLESGSDQVLAMVQKGATKELHVRAGLKVRRAGMELSEYYMPGLGGRALWKENALETADALNQINPDFIRLRTLAIPDRAPLAEEFRAGRFEFCPDKLIVREILTFIENLEGITSVVKSDHILNLFADLQGTMPQDQECMADMLRDFLLMDSERQCLYQVGRRLGVMACLEDLRDPHKLAAAKRACAQLGVTPDNVDQVTGQLMKRFI